jgi:hypothetical protein
MLKNIFGKKRDEVSGGWGKLLNLYSSASIIRMMKSRRVTWTEYVEGMGEKVFGKETRSRETTRKT